MNPSFVHNLLVNDEINFTFQTLSTSKTFVTGPVKIKKNFIEKTVVTQCKSDNMVSHLCALDLYFFEDGDLCTFIESSQLFVEMLRIFLPSQPYTTYSRS